MFNALLASNAAVDAVIVGIIVVFALFGFIKGFASMLLKFLAGFISLVLALVLCGRCAVVLNNLFSLTDALANSLSSSLGGVFGEELMSLPVSAFTEGTAAGAALPKFVVNLLLKLASDSSVPADIAVIDVLAPAFAYYIAAVIGFFVTYILLRVLFFLLSRFFRNVNKIPVLGAANRLLGFVLGAAQGFLVIYVLLSLIGILPFAFLDGFKTLLASSAVASGIMNINVFGIILGTVNPLDYIAGRG
ncbi:MAG: hypothetical protein DBX59_04615 [Bacillota bacterium]|nr:MAG: hypothetical protein DBX59_04615 [Bacillota bacterium]